MSGCFGNQMAPTAHDTGQGSYFEKSNYFLLKKIVFFLKFLKLSGNDYNRIRCSFGVLFPPPNHFNVTLAVFEQKSIFDEKIAIFASNLVRSQILKNRIFDSKNLFFQSSLNFQGMITIVFGAASGCCFPSKQ